jgi:hypothetical protein
VEGGRVGTEVVEDLTEIPVYSEFVKSPEYRDWVKSRE